MAGGLWMLMLVWACLAGVVFNDVEEREESYDESFEYDPDYRFDSNYLAMKKAANKMVISNMDIFLINIFGWVGVHYTFSKNLEFLGKNELASEALTTLTLVKSGKCVIPRIKKDANKEPLKDTECLTLPQARREFMKASAMSVYLANIIFTETNTITRLRWFKENGLEDIITLANIHVANLVKEFFPALFMPVTLFVTQIEMFKGVVTQRYTTGIGSSKEVVRYADAIVSGIYGIIDVVTSKKLKLTRFMNFMGKSFNTYRKTYESNFHDVRNFLPPQDFSSFYPVINRYWDAKAMEYAVAWIFVFKYAFPEDSKLYDNVLQDLHTKLLADETSEALNLAAHTLSSTLDRKSHKLLNMLEAAPIYFFPLDVLKIGMPSSLQEINWFRVPKTMADTDKTYVETVIEKYAANLEDGSISRYLFGN